MQKEEDQIVGFKTSLCDGQRKRKRERDRNYLGSRSNLE